MGWQFNNCLNQNCNKETKHLMDIKEWYVKYKSIILYLFFGVCTTAVNVIVYWVTAHLLQIETMSSTVIAWVIAVLFAYITNRKWVFHSNITSIKEIIREIICFFTCRLATGGVDWGCMFLFVNVIGMNDIFIKFIANIIVIVLNYIASKLIIFTKK